MSKQLRVDRCKFGLTWSCPTTADENPICSKEEVKEFLDTLGVNQYCISCELHESQKKHYHAWVKYDVKVVSKKATALFNLKGVHPNILNPKAGWLGYVQKHKDFITNVELDAWALALQQDTADEAMEVLWKKRPRDMCLNAHNVERNVRTRFALPSVPVFLGPFKDPGFYSAVDQWDRGTKSLHLWGPANEGKTSFAKTLFPAFTFVKGSIHRLRKVRLDLPLVFDDLTGLSDLPYGDMKILTDIVDGGSLKLMWGEITIPPGLPRVFLSNNKALFGLDVDEAVYGRRVQSFRIGAN